MYSRRPMRKSEYGKPYDLRITLSSEYGEPNCAEPTAVGGDLKAVFQTGDAPANSTIATRRSVPSFHWNAICSCTDRQRHARRSIPRSRTTVEIPLKHTRVLGLKIPQMYQKFPHHIREIFALAGPNPNPE